MSISQKVADLQQAFKEEFGVEVFVEAWVHDTTNRVLTEEKAVSIQKAIADESQELKPQTVDLTGGENASFMNYKVKGESFAVHLTVSRPSAFAEDSHGNIQPHHHQAS